MSAPKSAIDIPRIQAEARAAALREVAPLRDALEHIAQMVGAKANGADARAMSKFARDVLAAHFNPEANE